ncbi:uncharacterized protein [Miscanthus floridulus]|uniref:uncharacterized protein n=1 Tax=Miscanthus floridulus TaxID=154761 RepID=UPI0034596AAF
MLPDVVARDRVAGRSAIQVDSFSLVFPGPVARFRLARTTLRARVPAAEAWFRSLTAGDHRAREVSLICPPEWCHRALADPLLTSATLETLALGECRFSDAGTAAASASASASRLTDLSLSRTHISEAALQSLLSGCPALRNVIFRHIQGPRRIRITSCRSLVLFGVWHYKHREEHTVEDAPRLECLLGDVHLGASVTIIGAPKLTALGYLVVGFRNFFHGIDKPAVEEKVNKGLRAPFNSVKILAISMTFSSKKDMATVMNLLKCFSFLETLHIQGKPGERQVDTFDFGYYQKNEPIGCIVNHLKTVRLESKVKNLIGEVEERNMFEFVCFLLANAQVLQIMKIQSAMSNTPTWITEQQNLIQCHRASVEAKVVFEGLKVVHRKRFSIEAVNALPDPFDSDIDIMGY